MVDHVFDERATEVSLAQRDQPVQAFLLDRADQSLRVCIAVRRSKRDLDGADARDLEHIPNVGAPFPVAVADQDSLLAEHAVGRIGERANNLPHERLVRVRSGPDNPDTSRVQFNDEEGVVRMQTRIFQAGSVTKTSHLIGAFVC